jgi:hypothetical protein
LEPDSTYWGTWHDVAAGVLLRESEDPESPWRLVESTQYEAFVDTKTSIGFSSLSVVFEGGGERLINRSEQLEIGLIRRRSR